MQRREEGGGGEGRRGVPVRREDDRPTACSAAPRLALQRGPEEPGGEPGDPAGKVRDCLMSVWGWDGDGDGDGE